MALVKIMIADRHTSMRGVIYKGKQYYAEGPKGLRWDLDVMCLPCFHQRKNKVSQAWMQLNDKRLMDMMAGIALAVKWRSNGVAESQ